MKARIVTALFLAALVTCAAMWVLSFLDSDPDRARREAIIQACSKRQGAGTDAGSLARPPAVTVSPVPRDPAAGVQDYATIRPTEPVPFRAAPEPARPSGDEVRQAGTTPPAPVPQITYEEVVRRARQVEYEAGRRTALLSRDVPLTDDQVARVFRIYAKASNAYHPFIPIEGDTTTYEQPAARPTEVEDQILATLDDGQQAAIQQQWVDRNLWWTEIITRLAEDFPVAGEAAGVAPAEAGASPLAPAAPAAAAPAADTAAPQPAAHQGDNIFHLLENGR